MPTLTSRLHHALLALLLCLPALGHGLAVRPRRRYLRQPCVLGRLPDPDIIRVGEDFYFATSTFAGSPGMRILHSRDLINWTIAGCNCRA